MFGSVETEKHLAQAMEQLENLGTKPEAIVFTGTSPTWGSLMPTRG